MAVAETEAQWRVRLVKPSTGEVLYEYEPNPKQLIAHTCKADEIFYGGSKGSAKSFFLLWHNAWHCLEHGKDAKTVIFRRTYDELARNIIQEQIRHFHGRVGSYHSGDYTFRWNNGAITYFRHLERWEDTEKHHGAQYTLIAFDELTDFEERQYLELWRELRAPYGNIQPQMISGGMPGGIGHKWVYDRFIRDREPYVIYRLIDEDSGGEFTQIFVKAMITDNTALLKKDPRYPLRFKMTQSPDVYQALMKGDWTKFSGLAFREWDNDIHIVDEFKIPLTWKVIRTFDWGFSSPFSVGWLAQDPDTAAIYRICEWYGARRGAKGAIKGLEMSPSAVRQGILDRENANRLAGNFRMPRYGCADPSIWTRTPGKSVGDQINEGGALFNAGNNDRLGRKALFHSLLQIQPHTGKPGFMAFRSCPDFIDQIPKLVLDPKKPEDVESKNQQDHIYDDNGYGIMDLAEAPAQKRDPARDQMLRRLARRPMLV